MLPQIAECAGSGTFQMRAQRRQFLNPCHHRLKVLTLSDLRVREADIASFESRGHEVSRSAGKTQRRPEKN